MMHHNLILVDYKKKKKPAFFPVLLNVKEM
jgi:hypothetical protein